MNFSYAENGLANIELSQQLGQMEIDSTQTGQAKPSRILGVSQTMEDFEKATKVSVPLSHLSTKLTYRRSSDPSFELFKHWLLFPVSQARSQSRQELIDLGECHLSLKLFHGPDTPDE